MSVAAAAGSSNGRPKKEFMEVSTRLKRNKSETIWEEYSAEAVAFATQIKLREDGNLHAVNLMKEITEPHATAEEYVMKNQQS